MKELSIKEKAQRYDEAYKKVAVRFGSNVADEIFPELKESEDEKIRKEIKDFFSSIMLGQENFLREDYDWNAWIAWLEKQGEQKPQRMISAEAKEAMYDKPAWSEEDEERLDIIFERIERGLIIDKDDIDRLKSLKDRVQPKQEWSEEDRIKCNGAIHLLENLIKEEYFDRDSDDVQVASDLKFACKGLINWLKSLKGRVQQQPKKEWSKEDKKIANSIWDSIDKSVLANYGVDEDKAFEWLSHIKNRVLPQPKQEWSEEDKGIIDRAANYIKEYRWSDRCTNECDKQNSTFCEKWLKSLKDRYSWKPSDEQMRVLDLAIRCGINRGTTEETTLVSLFNDLKKLKDEK